MQLSWDRTNRWTRVQSLVLAGVIIATTMTVATAGSATAIPTAPSMETGSTEGRADLASTSPVADPVITAPGPSELAQLGCGACDVSSLCVNMGTQACNGFTNAVARGQGMEAFLGAALFGGVGTLGGAVLGAALGFAVGAAYYYTSTGGRVTDPATLIIGGSLFGVGAAIVGALVGLGFGVVFGISYGPQLFGQPPPPPPPRADLGKTGSRHVSTDVFSY